MDAAGAAAGDVEELKGEIERVGNNIRQMKVAHTDKVGVVMVILVFEILEFFSFIKSLKLAGPDCVNYAQFPKHIE